MRGKIRKCFCHIDIRYLFLTYPPILIFPMDQPKTKESYAALFDELRATVNTRGWLGPSPWYGTANLVASFSLYVLGIFLI